MTEASPYHSDLPEYLAAGGHAAQAFAVALQRAIQEVCPVTCPNGFGLRSLARRLDITTTLAAATLRTLHAPDPIGVLAALPGERGRRALVRKIAASGVARETSIALAAALQQLEEILEADGHDRETLKAFVSARQSPKRARANAARGLRETYECASQLWGVRQAGLVTAMWFAPAADGVHCNAAGGQLFRRLERLRPGPRVGICWPPTTDGGDGRYQDRPEVTKPLGCAPDSPLISEFGSPSLIPSEIEVCANGEVSFGAPQRSRAGGIDVGVAFALPKIGRIHSIVHTECGENNVNVSIPTGSLTSEVWLHRDLARGGDPAASFYNTALLAGNSSIAREHLRVPLYEQVEEGTWPCALPPQLAELCERHELLGRRLAAQLGRDPAEFTCFRVSLQHPPVHTALTLRWKLAHAAS